MSEISVEAPGSESPSQPRPDNRLLELLRAVQTGSTSALSELIAAYEPQLRRVVQRRFNQRLRSKFDTMDFVQMAWKSFFARPELVRGFVAPAQLAAYLAKMVTHKVDGEHRRRLDAQKHDVAREQPLQGDELPGGAPNTPSQIAMAHDHWDGVLRGLPPTYREVVRLRLEGLRRCQIAERLAISERSVRRILQVVQEAASKKESLG